MEQTVFIVPKPLQELRKRKAMAEPPSQLARACQECNRKKTRCDMQRPVCGLCQRTGNTCNFPLKRRAPISRGNRSKPMSGQVNVNLVRLIRLLESSPDSIDQIRESSLPLAGSDGQLSATFTDRLESNGSPRSEPNGDDFRPSEFAAIQTLPVSEAVFPRNSPGREAEARVRNNPQSIERSQSPVDPTQLELSFTDAMHLIDLFFSKIQPWLPLLHKPSFCQRYTERFHHGIFDLKTIPVDDALLLSSLFALSARYSSSGAFAAIPQADLCDRFAAMARQFYDGVRALTQPTLTSLQGYIMLAFYYYTSGLSMQGWILIGVCVRYAYEIDLCDLDDDECSPASGLEWIRIEEMRRAWWLVWELDTFGSILCKRPYAVDRRRMAVMLPVSDEAWFSGNSTSSSKLITRPGQSWKSLQGIDSNDNNERAWFLIANHLMSLAHEAFSQKDGISARDKMILENDISCFKLSLPSSFRLSTEILVFDAASFARSNCIIATNLMLAGTSFMMHNLRLKDEDGHNPVEEPKDASMAFRKWAFDLSRIVGLWSADYIVLAHPFLACLTIPPHVPFGQGESSDPQILSSSRDLAGLVQSRFAEKWRLGFQAQRVSELKESPDEMTAEDLNLARRYPIFFPPAVKMTSSPSTFREQDQQPASEDIHDLQARPDDQSWHIVNDDTIYTSLRGVPHGHLIPPGLAMSPMVQGNMPSHLSGSALDFSYGPMFDDFANPDLHGSN